MYNLTEEEELGLVDAYKQGHKLISIKKHFNLDNDAAVYEVLRKHGVESNRKPQAAVTRRKRALAKRYHQKKVESKQFHITVGGITINLVLADKINVKEVQLTGKSATVELVSV